MRERRVTGTSKGSDGDITGLCNVREPWSPVSKKDAISHIKKESHNYYVILNGRIIDIHVGGTPPNEYLQTDPGKTTENHLVYLPDCQS